MFVERSLSMNYIKELLIILFISFIGEILNHFIPLPIPACVYGLVIMFLALCLKIIKIDKVKNTSKFLIEIMPLMFIPAGVGLISSFNELKPMLLSVSIITVITTILVMAVTGVVSQKVCNHDERRTKSSKMVKQINQEIDEVNDCE